MVSFAIGELEDMGNGKRPIQWADLAAIKAMLEFAIQILKGQA